MSTRSGGREGVVFAQDIGTARRVLFGLKLFESLNTLDLQAAGISAEPQMPRFRGENALCLRLAFRSEHSRLLTTGGTLGHSGGHCTNNGLQKTTGSRES